MASTTQDKGLSAEPSQPEVRREQHLAAKSYVDAVQEDPAHATDKLAISSNSNGIANPKSSHSDAVNGGQHSRSNGKTNSVGKGKASRAAVIRILSPGDERKLSEPTSNQDSAGNNAMPSGDNEMDGLATLAEKLDDATVNVGDSMPSEPTISTTPKESKGGRPTVQRQESKHEYEAAGLDESPKSSPRHKHRKTQSRSSNESKQPSLTKDDADAFETFQDKSSNGKLISVKQVNGNYQRDLEQSQKEAKPVRRGDDKGLVSGRQAGKRWEQTPIRFAPLNVPLQRRLQTLVVLFHSSCIALSVSIFFFLCAIPIFWPLLIPYMIWVMSSNAGTSGTLKYRSNFLRSLPVWSLFASYFPARLHRTAELPPTRKYIFGYHPHGIISHGAFAAFCTEALGFSQLFPGITNTLLTLDSNFRIPIYRDYALAMGLASVSRESCENLLSKGGANKEGMGRAITIVVGGARESLDAEPYSLRLVLKRRKGFVKMALRTGADLVPVLAFGENDLYDQFLPHSHPKIHKMQLLLKKMLGFTIPLFHARGVFNYDVGLMPYRRPLNVVVGRPIKVTQSLKPTQEEIDTLHEKYVTELVRLWDTWKDDFAKNRKGELEILE